MRILTDKEYQLFEHLTQLNQEQIHSVLFNYLKKHYADVQNTKSYIYATGEIPVLLAAHMDTVFPTPTKNVYYDTKKNVLWSPEGLGADDRAGIFGIIQLIQKGYRPSILFSADEELGAIGASIFAQKVTQPPKEIKYIIQLDRRGKEDCVFYNCNNKEFKNYVLSFGFKENYGTFTDISKICPVWDVAGVNLSIGYENEHSYNETFHIDNYHLTIERVCKMLDDIKNINQVFEYEDNFYSSSFTIAPNEEYLHCECCNNFFNKSDLFRVTDLDESKKYYCINCINSAFRI